MSVLPPSRPPADRDAARRGPAPDRHDPPLAAGTWSAEVATVRVIFGAGCLVRVAELARELDAGRPLVVTDPGVRRAGHARAATAALQEAGLAVALFDGVDENPTCEHVEAGAEVARRHRADLLVGLGGGSAMDCTKGINFLVTQGGEMEDYWGFGKAMRPMLPSIGVPTTAGTGSDAQSYALITRPSDHRKMACGDRKARFRTVLLDPELAATTPPRVAATAGLDALAHAVESYVTRRRNPLSALYAREAWRLLATSLEATLFEASEEEAAAARGRMLWGAHLAGAAIEASMLGAAHAAANPLTAACGVPHGVAVALMLPHVVRRNGPVALAEEIWAESLAGGTARSVADLYGELLSTVGEPVDDDPTEALARRLEALREVAGLPEHLRQVGVNASDLGDLAGRAAAEWTGDFNPAPLAEDDFVELYRRAL